MSLGLLQIKSHYNQNGGITSHYSSPGANKEKIEVILAQQLKFKGLTPKELAIWSDRIDEAVQKALVIYMSVAKL